MYLGPNSDYEGYVEPENTQPVEGAAEIADATQPNVPPTTAAIKAKKATVAFPNVNFDEVYKTILSGKEDYLRENFSANKRIQGIADRQRLLSEIAQRKGGMLSPQEVDSVFKATEPDVGSVPYTVMEENYNRKFVDSVSEDKNTDVADIEKQQPEYVKALKEAGSVAAAKRDVAANIAQEIHDQIKGQSGLSNALDIGKLLLPFYYEAKMRGNVDDVGFFDGLIGSNLSAQAKSLLSLTLPEFTQKLRDITDRMRKDNPQLAQSFVLAVAGMSTSDVFLDNALGIAGAASGLSSVPLVVKGVRAIDRSMRAARAVKQIVKESAKSEVENIDVLRPTAAGDIGEAGVQKASARILQKIKGGGPQAATSAEREAIENLPTGLRTDLANIKNNPGRLGEDIALRIEQDANKTERNFFDVLLNTANVIRAPLEKVTPDVLRQLKEEIKGNFPGLENSILDISSPYFNRITKTVHYDVIMGKPNGELFGRLEEARQFAKMNNLDKAAIKTDIGEQGTRYYIKLTKPFNETSNIWRDAIAELPEYKSPDGWNKGFLNWLRGSDDTLAMEQRINRKLATYAASNLRNVVKEEIEGIKQLSHGIVNISNERKLTYPLYRLRGLRLSNKEARQRWSDWERAVKFSKYDVDAEGKQGHFFDNVQQLEDFYQRNIGRLPDGDEIRAYFSFKRVIELDRVLRNITVFRNKTRVGAESHRVFVLDGKGQRNNSEYFDGVLKREFPGGSEYDKILVMGDVLGGESVETLSKINKFTLTKLRRLVKEGQYKVIEIYDPERRPLSNFSSTVGDQRVRYVVSPNVETKPLSYEQVARRGGGHFDYDYDHYVKQAIVRPERIGKGRNAEFAHWYEGDTTVMPVQIRKMGQDVANHLNNIRESIRSGDLAGAEAYAQKHLAAIDFSTIKGWFDSKRLSLDEPFVVVPRNKMIVQMDDSIRDRYTKTTKDGKVVSTFKDGTREGSLARQAQVEYTGQRDAFDVFSLRDEGTAQNPLYKQESARIIDPIPSMNRALNKIINSAFMDDYKTFSVEQWLSEAGKYLAADKSEIRYSPYYYFHHPVYRTGVDENIKQSLEANRYKIQQLLGVPSVIETYLNSAAQRLADSVYSNFGPKGFPLLFSQALYKTKNLPAFVRSATFHAKLGMFNPAQILVQAQTYAVIHSVAGFKHSVPGTYAAYLNQLSRLNRHPEIMEGLDRLATKMRIPGTNYFKPGEFTEATKLLQETGFDHVGPEYAALDTAAHYKLTQSRFGEMLNAGTGFFQMGERNVRLGAWYTAYKEFRTANPAKRITETDRANILERADLLYVNMSRASQSILHSGILSWPTQFLTYQLRLGELFLGKRLAPTPGERNLIRARMLLYHSILYGAPVAAGVTGAPLADFLRKEAIQNGYTVGDKWYETMVMEGLPSFLIGSTTGQYVNIGERYGSPGFEFLNNFGKTDASLWTIFGGAPTSVLSNTWANTDGFRHAMMSLLKDDGESFPVTVQDIVDAGKELSVVNNAARGIVAANTGKWISKREGYLTDVNPWGAVLMSVTGLQPQEVSQLHVISGSYKDRLEMFREAEKGFTREFNHFIQDNSDGNYDQAKRDMARAHAYLKVAGYPEEDYARLVSRAGAQANQNLAQKINWDFYMKHVSPENKELYYTTMKKIIKKEGP